MGCKNSKPKEPAATVVEPLTTRTAEPAPPKKKEPAELFVQSFLEESNTFFSSLCEGAWFQEVQGVVFLNSVAEFLRLTFRMRMAPTQELLKNMLPTGSHLASWILKMEDHVADDGYMRLLNGWEAQNPQHDRKISAKAMRNILRGADVHFPQAPEGTFATLLTVFRDCTQSNKQITELFDTYSSNKLTLTTEEFMKMVREAQGMETVTLRAVTDKIRNRFGGCVTKYNFASYHSGLITNSAYDPQRATTVWMDMTQPLPHYLISTTRVESETDLGRALKENARSLVLSCRKREDGKIYSGDVQLQVVLDQIKAYGFKDNAYPIVLCFNPDTPLPLDLQEEVAALVKEKLGHMLGRGIMFEGAMLNDPNFSPAALQKKVLLMGFQAPLKPFVGFHVADMNRDGLGVRVTDVQEATPASKAGIVKDDWITHINSLQIQNKQDLKQRLMNFKLGDEFSMKKENLDEVRVVVGGAVTASDEKSAQALSDLIFLKFVNDEVHSKYYPWESSVSHGCEGDLPVKNELMAHFMFVSQPVSPPRNRTERELDFAGEAASRGIQFVDVGGNVDTHIWSRGLFAENARCGYVLKDGTSKPQNFEVTVRIISPPFKAHKSTLSNATVTVHGIGNCLHEPFDTFKFTDCESSTVAAIVMEFTSGDGETLKFVASFPPLLLRNGYRELPTVEATEELDQSPPQHGVFCHIKIMNDFDSSLMSVQNCASMNMSNLGQN